MERKLINYLPPFIQEYREIKAIMDSEQNSVEKAWNDAENILDDQFVRTATENGVSRYERLLGIIPKGTYTLEERKFNILARMNEQLPYTMKQLESSLASLCGENGYTLKLTASEYALIVKLALTNENNADAVKELLKKMLPANINWVVSLFNTYHILGGFTHEQLAAYTHENLKLEIL